MIDPLLVLLICGAIGGSLLLMANLHEFDRLTGFSIKDRRTLWIGSLACLAIVTFIRTF